MVKYLKILFNIEFVETKLNNIDASEKNKIEYF